jgi:hypothetical protein
MPLDATVPTSQFARMRNLLVPVLSLAAVAACRGADATLVLPAAQMLEAPAAPGSAQPYVAADGDRLILSWTEPDAGGHALRFASFDGERWSAPATIASGADWFVNWADFPSVVSLRPGHLAAHWLQRSGPGRYSYDVLFTQSADGGVTWSPAQRPHRDGTESEHGFVSLFPHGDGAGAIWLDGRRFVASAAAPATSEMMLLFTTASPAGALGPELTIDDRICDCCQTSVALTGRGPLVVYRDRSPGEVRDIGYSRFDGTAWSAPRLVHADGWVINACPVNGPAADAAGEDVVVAWFTAAQNTPRVNVAFSRDAGESFGAPLRIDQGDAIGRVDAIMVDGRAFVVWMERVGDGAEVRGRLVAMDGTLGPVATIGTTEAGRSAGFPRMAAAGQRVLLAWTEPGDPSEIRAAQILLPH